MIYDTSPTSDEAAMARLSYLQWERSNAEELAQYVYRRRTVDLAYLTAQVVENELTACERSAVGKVYYDRLTVTAAAQQLGINRATLAKTLDRAMKKIEHFLKYAVMYQYNLREVEFLPAAVRRSLVLCARQRYKPSCVGGRIRHLRECENISAALLAQTINVEEKRLAELEDGSKSPTAQELLAIAACFETTADYILTGKK